MSILRRDIFCGGRCITDNVASKILNEDDKLQMCLERDRLFCDAEFARSPTMRKLLRFLVDHRLSDTGKPLKAYTIAVDALGRDESFDSQIDSYPRVQIGRLRRMLDHFYLREGGECRLSIPHGHYEILLGLNDMGAAPDVRTGQPGLNDESGMALLMTQSNAAGKKRLARSHMLIALLLVVLLIMAASYYLSRNRMSNEVGYPAIIVEDPQGMMTISSQARVVAMQTNLGGSLENFEQVKVYDAESTGDARLKYLLQASVMDEAANRIQFRLVNSVTKEVIWSDRIDTPETGELEPSLGRLAITIASPYGVIAQNELARYRDDFSLGYPCILQFHQYLRFRDEAKLRPTLKCVEDTAKRYPGDAYILSMLSVAKGISERVDVGYRIDGSAALLAEQAVKLDSQSASAAFAVAQAAFFAGNCRKCVAWGKRAVELNPLNSRIMGYLGMYMLGCRMPEGREYAARALDMDPNADLAIAAVLAIQQLQTGDAKSARALSLKYLSSAQKPEPGLELAYVLSSAMLGDRKEARRVWKQLTGRYGLRPNATPRQVMSKWIANPDLIREAELIFERVKF